MKPYFSTESNRYAQAIKVSVPKTSTSLAIYINASQPYRLSGVLGKFAANASGAVTIKVIRAGQEFSVFSQNFSSAGNFFVSDINVWLGVNARNALNNLSASNPGTDVVVIDNQSNQDLTCVVDFIY